MKLATFVNFSWNSVVIIYLVVKQCPSVPQWHATIESPILWELLHSFSFILSQTLSSIRLVLNMNRKLSNLMPAAANMVSNLGNRAGTGYDQVWKLNFYNEIRNLWVISKCVKFIVKWDCKTILISFRKGMILNVLKKTPWSNAYL